MLFNQVDLTTALRPVLLPDESLLFVQDAVGLYEGKYKIPTCQQGHAYLTSHRACYIDDQNPRAHSLAIDLRDVDRPEFQAWFLRSSPKVILYPKPLRRGIGSLRVSATSLTSPSPIRLSSPSSPVSRTSSPFRPTVSVAPIAQSTGTWICPICTFSNPIPSNFDPATVNSAFPIPPCQTCGIKPTFAHVLKAAISAASSNRNSQQPAQTNPRANLDDTDLSRPAFNETQKEASEMSVTCPKCTFHNHPSLLSCEVCGASLLTSDVLRQNKAEPDFRRAESPGPLLDETRPRDASESESVKFSFRGGGERIFFERLKGALVQRKWLLQNAPPIPRPKSASGIERPRYSPQLLPDHEFRPVPTLGIASLEQIGMKSRKNNELVIGNAFEDLEALMASAKEIVALAEQFAVEAGRGSGGRSAQADSVLSQSAAALGMVTTKDLFGGGSDNLYISELSRNLAEYLTDDSKSILRNEGGIMSLVDLWQVYNRSRNGVELVSPTDFERAAQLWERLGLPVRLRRFKSGLLVVQGQAWSDDKVISQVISWFQELRKNPPADPIEWDWEVFGYGVTAQDAAQKFGWSIGVANEELEMAEDRGVVCREEGIEGVKFWENHLKFEPGEEESSPKAYLDA